MIRKTQHYQKMYVKSWSGVYKDNHTETHLVTTYWFLFIPVLKIKKVIHTTIK